MFKLRTFILYNFRIYGLSGSNCIALIMRLVTNHKF